jgi:hypothetical protein
MNRRDWYNVLRQNIDGERTIRRWRVWLTRAAVIGAVLAALVWYISVG